MAEHPDGAEASEAHKSHYRAAIEEKLARCGRGVSMLIKKGKLEQARAMLDWYEDEIRELERLQEIPIRIWDSLIVLGLSTQLTDRLMWEGILTIEDLLYHSVEDISRVFDQRVGLVACTAIKQALSERGIQWPVEE